MYVKMSVGKGRWFCPGVSMLTFVVLQVDYPVITKSIPLLLMPGSFRRQVISNNGINHAE